MPSTINGDARFGPKSPVFHATRDAESTLRADANYSSVPLLIASKLVPPRPLRPTTSKSPLAVGVALSAFFSLEVYQDDRRGITERAGTVFEVLGTRDPRRDQRCFPLRVERRSNCFTGQNSVVKCDHKLIVAVGAGSKKELVPSGVASVIELIDRCHQGRIALHCGAKIDG